VPLASPTAGEYSRLCFRASVHHARDAVVAFKGARYVSAIISCQHAWEMAGKAALAIDGAFAWPPSPRTWMVWHAVMSDVHRTCTRLKFSRRIENALLNLEQWLPPSSRTTNPGPNSEYFFDSVTAWALPADYFGALHARTSIRAIQRVIPLVKAKYQSELKGLRATVPAI